LRRNESDSENNIAKNLAIIDILQKKAKRENISLTQLILEWTLFQNGVSTILVGMRKESHLKPSLLAASTKLKIDNIFKK